MCGIAGYFYIDQRKDASAGTIRNMIEKQKHRGPDDSAILAIDTDNELLNFTSNGDDKLEYPSNLFFGFNRLSILDLSLNGRQPMLGDNGRVALMMNGEIYNAFDYKEELVREGFHFNSTTDTEVVLNLYLKYGMDRMIKKLNGMYAIVIWDMRIKTLYLARDRFGIKPLYLLRDKGRLAFSSEMKSFGELHGFAYDLDKDKLDEFLLFRNVINDTLFKNIQNCTPGTYISVNQSGAIVENQFYDINDEGCYKIPREKAFCSLETSLQQSVQRQMISDVKLGCQLSGGVDSSLVSYYAKQSLKEDALETISIDFSNPRYSEKRYIDEVARNLKLLSHQYIMSPEYYFEELDNATWHFEQPLNHPNTIGIYLLSQRAKKHVTVLLSGEGADEALAGYERFIRINTPYFNKDFLRRIKQNASSLVSFLRYYCSDDNRRVMESSFGSIRTAKDVYPEFNVESGIQKRVNYLEQLDGSSILRQRKYELLTYLPDLLMRQDKMSMAHSIENRVPFLDNEMITTSLNIPDEELISNRNGKKEAKLLLKKLCMEKFNESLAFRRKRGFGVPLQDFMSSSFFLDRWESEIVPGIEKRGIFRIKSVSEWVSNIKMANPIQLDAIWLMTGFELWAKKYLDV